MSAITTELLQEKLQANVKGVELLTVADTSDGCGAKFAVVIVATSFESMTAVERHQAILGKDGVLADEMKTVRGCWPARILCAAASFCDCWLLLSPCHPGSDVRVCDCFAFQT